MGDARQQLLDLRDELLARIEGALRRLDTGEFGLCFVCGEEVAATRLAVDPTTTRCIKCADA